MYFVFPKILYFLKINFYASYAFEGDFISSLLVFRRLSQKVGRFRLKCVPMFVTVLPVLINHEHRHFLFIIKTYILVERLQKQTFVKYQTSQGKKKEGFRR